MDSVLRTTRLRLRPFTTGDLDAHLALYSDPAVTRYLGGGPFVGGHVRDRSERAVYRFVTHWAKHGFGVWAVEDRGDGRLIGQCGLNTLDAIGSDDVEILWALERVCWGRGLATEAAVAALHHAFETVGLARVVALAQPGNRASLRVMDKLGLAYEKTVHAFGVEVVCYATDRARYRERRLDLTRGLA